MFMNGFEHEITINTLKHKHFTTSQVISMYNIKDTLVMWPVQYNLQ